MLAGAVGMGAAAFFDNALVASPTFDKILMSLVMGGISMEAGAIANALTSNRGMAITTRQAAANQQIVYGQQRVGGVIIKQRTSGSSNDQMNYVIVLAGHECDSIQNLYLDGRQVHWQAGSVGNSTRNGINFGGNADSNTYTGPNGVQYNFGGTGHSGLYCEARYGDQLDGDVIGALTANCPEWAADGEGNSPWVGGCTYVYLKIEFNTTLFPNEPDIRFTVNGKNNIWDPRSETAVFTSNWALIAADIITDPVFGLGDNTVNQLNLIAAANVCDEQVDLAAIAGQTEARYACNYHYDTSTTPGDALQAIMSCAQGAFSQIGGQYYLFPAYWAGPSFSFSGSNLTAAFQWSAYHSVPDRINRVNGTYIAPTYPYNIAGNLYDENGFYDGQIQDNFPFAFQPTNFPQYACDTLHGYPSDEWLAADNGEEHPIDLALTSVLSLTQAQRLAKIALLRNRFEGTAVLEMNLSSYVMQPKDIFEFTFAPLGWTNHLLEVSKVDFVVDQDQDSGAQCIRIRYTVVETDPSIYDWTPDSEELTIYDIPASPDQAPAAPTPPTNMTLNSGPSVAQINPDGTVNNLIVVGWDTPLDNLAIGIMIQYRLTGSTTWIAAPSQGITLNSSWISNVVPGAAYDVEIASYRANGQVSTWVEQGDYTVVNTPTDLGTLAAQLPVITANSQLAGINPNEMLTNGNFANATTGAVAGWTLSNGSGELTISTAEFKNATQSLLLDNQTASQSVNVIGGRTYLFQIWVMTDGSVYGGPESQGAGAFLVLAAGSFTLLASNTPGNHFGVGTMDIELPATAATPWTLLQMVVSVSESCSMTVNVQNSIGGGTVAGNAYFDGVSLTDVTTQSNQLGGQDASLITPITTVMTTNTAGETVVNSVVMAGASENIVPNNNFVIGPMEGWGPGNMGSTAAAFTYGSDSNGPRAYQPSGAANAASGMSSPAFQVIPGNKYRLNYCGYNTTGSGGIYFRLTWQPGSASNVLATSAGTSSSNPGSLDLLGGGSVTTTPTVYSYDWTAPAGATYASMLFYAVGASDLAVQYVSCVPYASSAQWGSDVTGANTSNDTNNVDGIPASTIAQVVPTGYELFINNGDREYSFQAI